MTTPALEAIGRAWNPQNVFPNVGDWPAHGGTAGRPGSFAGTRSGCGEAAPRWEATVLTSLFLGGQPLPVVAGGAHGGGCTDWLTHGSTHELAAFVSDHLNGPRQFNPGTMATNAVPTPPAPPAPRCTSGTGARAWNTRSLPAITAAGASVGSIVPAACPTNSATFWALARTNHDGLNAVSGAASSTTCPGGTCVPLPGSPVFASQGTACDRCTPSMACNQGATGNAEPPPAPDGQTLTVGGTTSTTYTFEQNLSLVGSWAEGGVSIREHNAQCVRVMTWFRSWQHRNAAGAIMNSGTVSWAETPCSICTARWMHW